MRKPQKKGSHGTNADCRFGFEAEDGRPLFKRCSGSCHCNEDDIEAVTTLSRSLGILSGDQACLDGCRIITKDERAAYLAEDETTRPYSPPLELSLVERALLTALDTASAGED